jgi:hypothetical protein
VRIPTENGLSGVGVRIRGSGGLDGGRLPGISRPPKDPDGSCSRIMHLEAKFGRNSSSAGRAWSALSPEAAGGSMTWSQVG